jgi:hypothetical protein
MSLLTFPYFAPTYFPPTYFGGLQSVGLASIPGDFLDAVVARVQAQLVATAKLTWFGTCESPGFGQAALPYGVLSEPDEDTTFWSTQGDGLAEGHIEIQCFAPTKKAARLLGDLCFSALHDAPLQFAAGLLIYLRQSGRTAFLDPDPAPGGGDCWVETRTFHFLYSF